MKIIKPVVIVPARVETPQCCALVETPPGQAWRIDRYKRMRPDYDPLKCQRPSSIEIDGKCYCRLHAAHIALEKWIVGDLIEVVK